MILPNFTESQKNLVDPVESAKAVGLRYVTDAQPGIRRKARGKKFVYLDPKGKVITDENELKRIRSLIIPPAWSDVWICPIPNGHLQATGRDAKRRKQYRYHPRWREIRDQTKYSRMIPFAKVLPQIRKQVQKDLALKGLPREKILATVVRLLECTGIRVGNEEYAKNNHSFGLTTLRDHHVDVTGSSIQFRFKGKTGVTNEVDIQDKRLAKILRNCQDIPGQELFQYIDEDGKVQDIDSADVNDYIRNASGGDFTAKDFRTWVGTVCAAQALRELGPCQSLGQRKKNIVLAIKKTAERLSNRPATCRKFYIHPSVLNGYTKETVFTPLKCSETSSTRLSPQEMEVLEILKKDARAQKERHNKMSKLPASWRN